MKSHSPGEHREEIEKAIYDAVMAARTRAKRVGVNVYRRGDGDMSACISRRGEYSSHELDDEQTCKWCGVFDEEAFRRVNIAAAEARGRQWAIDALHGAEEETNYWNDFEDAASYLEAMRDGRDWPAAAQEETAT